MNLENVPSERWGFGFMGLVAISAIREGWVKAGRFGDDGVCGGTSGWEDGESMELSVMSMSPKTNFCQADSSSSIAWRVSLIFVFDGRDVGVSLFAKVEGSRRSCCSLAVVLSCTPCPAALRS